MSRTENQHLARAARLSREGIKDLAAIARGGYFDEDEKTLAWDIVQRSEGADARTLVDLNNEATALTGRAAQRKATA